MLKWPMTGKIIVSIFARLLLNTARRFIYPFAPFFSRRLGVPFSSVTALIAVNQATSIPGVFLAPLGDRLGYKSMMLASIILMAAGMLGAGFIPHYGIILTAMFMAGMAKSIFDPSLQAYISRQVPYQKRGRVIGLLELAWAGSILAGIPLMGFLIDSVGWRGPFFALGFGALVALGLIYLFISPDPAGRERSLSKGIKISQLRNHRVLGMAGFSLFLSLGNDCLLVVYGSWFEQDFSISITGLGLGLAVVGGAEILGELLTAFMADKLGLHKSIVAGTLVTGCGYLLLPLLGTSQFSALAGLFLLFLGFEFTVVSAMSLCTEILPRSRSSMMGIFFAAAGIGRVLGVLLGGFLWPILGLTGIGFSAAFLTLAALGCLKSGLKKKE